VFQTDINPAARIGRGIFLDHATGLVVGETAVIEDGVSMLQDVTLGGTGKEDGDRHPKICAEPARAMDQMLHDVGK
jgi:serine O-acetyltransferase